MIISSSMIMYSMFKEKWSGASKGYKYVSVDRQQLSVIATPRTLLATYHGFNIKGLWITGSVLKCSDIKIDIYDRVFASVPVCFVISPVVYE